MPPGSIGINYHTSNVWSPKLLDNTVTFLSPLRVFGPIFRAIVGNIARALCFKSKQLGIDSCQSLAKGHWVCRVKSLPLHWQNTSQNTPGNSGSGPGASWVCCCNVPFIGLFPSNLSSQWMSCRPCIQVSPPAPIKLTFSQQGDPSIGYSLSFSELSHARVRETLTEGSPSVSWGRLGPDPLIVQSCSLSFYVWLCKGGSQHAWLSVRKVPSLVYKT